jgi:endonuclease YncB( thermonuclease family)
LVALLLLIPTTAASGQFKITRVYDGDTVKAEGHDIEITVRLVGIDAPETSRKKGGVGQPYSQHAKKHLAGLVLNKTVDVKGYGTDRYNRILGVIVLVGKNINLQMLEAGFAEVYRGKPTRGLDLATFWEAEKQARRSDKGMCLRREVYQPGSVAQYAKG